MSIPSPLGHSARVRPVSERMPFLSSNKDSCRTHQSSQRLHQICTVSSSSDSGFLTLRNISLARVPDRRNPSSDLSRSFDEKCDNDAFLSPMDDAIYSSRDFQDALAVAPIEIMPLTNVENVTPVKYPSLDLSDLSFSSLNESLEGSENFPGASNLETPNARRVSFPNRRREYVLSKRPLGALGTGVITSSVAPTKGRQSNNRSSFFEEGRSNRDVLNTSLQLKKALENQSDRRKTIHSWQVLSPPKKVQRSESTPDSYTAREPWKTPTIKSKPTTTLPAPGRRESRPPSLDLQVCSKSGGLECPPRTDRQISLQGFKFQSTQAASGHPLFGGEETLEKPAIGLKSKLIFSPSKNGLPLVRVKRSTPIILSRKGKTKNSLLTLSQNSTHFTPSKFLNNPQSSTPVSKRLRDRRNSLLDDVHDTNLTTPFNPSCKKQIFPDLDDPVLAPHIPHPVLSLESTAAKLQVDFDQPALPPASEGHKDPLITPSKELTGSYQDDQMFSPMRLFVDSPVGRDIREIINNSTDSLESAIDFQLASSVAGFDTFFDMAVDCFNFEDEDKVAAPMVIQPQPIGESRSAVCGLVRGEASSREGLGNVRITVDDESGNYFVSNSSEEVEILISYNKVGQIFNVAGNVVPGELRNFEQQQQRSEDNNVSVMNVTDIMENDLPDTFMKVVCCETTHRKSLVQQAREVLGVSEPPKS